MMLLTDSQVRKSNAGPTLRFRKLVDRSSHDLNDHVYTYISFYHASTQDSDSTVKIARQVRWIVSRRRMDTEPHVRELFFPSWASA